MRAFPAIRIEGGLFAPDLFDRLMEGDPSDQRPADFGLGRRADLTAEIAAAFADAESLWRIFQRRVERLREDDPGTSVTRDAWVVPFLGLLRYDLHYNPQAHRIDGMTFAISHRAGEAETAPPVHIVGIHQPLDRRAPSGRPRLSPHALVQEYLNRSETLWGLVTNGRRLRLLRASADIHRQSFVEFDLGAIFEQHLFEDFAVLFRLLHRTRLPRAVADAAECPLERYYVESIEQGGRVRDHLRDGVEECLQRLANGFLTHPRNDDLRRRVAPRDATPDLIADELYRQLLRLVYRFLFLLVSEDRGLISDDRLYLEHYGISRFRRLVDRRGAYTEHDDLWLSLRVLWKLFGDDTPVAQLDGRPLAAVLNLPVLNGELFEPLVFDDCRIRNRDLLDALWHLIYYREDHGSLRRVNYAALDVEELGSVYESLLEYSAVVEDDGGRPRFRLLFGTQRKTTGSYYTPPPLVAELIRSALDPVIERRLKEAAQGGASAARIAADPAARRRAERALLSIRVVDPASGSGHFLLAAARRLATELARVRTGEDQPPPDRIRAAKRDVVAHCIYGVDKNPLAVELCRVALWLEAHCRDKPLTFLEHRIRCGDSLVGVFDLNVLETGIPDDAYKPVHGDDAALARAARHRNREHRGSRLFAADLEDALRRIGQQFAELDDIPDDSPEQIRHKRRLCREIEDSPEFRALHRAADAWTAAFFQPYTEDAPPPITAHTLRQVAQTGQCEDHRQDTFVTLTAERERFFHWPLEFPEVFATGRFDVVLGNPPWERIKLQEKEFFAGRDRAIADAPNAATRRRLIQRLRETNPALWQEYRRALHSAESLSRFLRGSGLFPLTGRGDINTYSVFAERMRGLLAPRGRAGVIVPTGIATDSTNRYFFGDCVEHGRLVSLFDFENRERLFPTVDARYKFCLLTLCGKDEPTEAPRFAFFATNTGHLRDPRRVFTLSAEDIARINPNTRTLPVFRTRQDADLTKAIYRRVPVLVNEATDENPWGIRFLRMFDMSNDSHLFRTREQLESAGCRLVGNRFLPSSPSGAAAGSEGVYLPLYEAKMIWQYDHRFGTYEGVRSRSSTHLPSPNEEAHANPALVVQPWYWVSADAVQARIQGWKRGWLLGFRDVTNATNERTAIFSLIPAVGVGNNLPLIITAPQGAGFLACLLADLDSVVFDYVTRQKIAGTHMNFFFVAQLPVSPRSAYRPVDVNFIVPRVLELTYTAWDIKPFADDVWTDADAALQEAILAQATESAAETGGNDWSLPDWIDAYPEIETDPARGIPLPPFKWDEGRRARLRAELDAYYARLYGLTRKQLRYILDPADLTERELADILDPAEEVDDPLDPDGYAARCAASDFPGETFRVLKDKELRRFGEYRTRRLVLEAWHRLPD